MIFMIFYDKFIDVIFKIAQGKYDEVGIRTSEYGVPFQSEILEARRMSIDQFKPNDWQRDDVLENEAAVDFTNANKVPDIDLRAATIGRPGSPVGPPGFWLLCIKSRNLMSRDH